MYVLLFLTCLFEKLDGIRSEVAACKRQRSSFTGGFFPAWAFLESLAFGGLGFLWASTQKADCTTNNNRNKYSSKKDGSSLRVYPFYSYPSKKEMIYPPFHRFKSNFIKTNKFFSRNVHPLRSI